VTNAATQFLRGPFFERRVNHPEQRFGGWAFSGPLIPRSRVLQRHGFPCRRLNVILAVNFAEPVVY